MRHDEQCPCGSNVRFDGCCLPLHHGERHAESAEQLMRSRYTAYAIGNADYLWRTWHPSTRPDGVAIDPAIVWTGLEIVRCVGGQHGDQTGEVDFVARHRNGILHERSRFAVRARRWFYVDGDVS